MKPSIAANADTIIVRRSTAAGVGVVSEVNYPVAADVYVIVTGPHTAAVVVMYPVLHISSAAHLVRWIVIAITCNTSLE